CTEPRFLTLFVYAHESGHPEPAPGINGGRSTPCPRLLDPRFRGCNPIGIDEHGHDFDMSLSRCPGESRDPCFHKSLSLNVFCDRAPRESPRRLRYGSRPAPGRRDMQRRAMNANWITASFAGTTKCWPKQVSDE